MNIAEIMADFQILGHSISKLNINNSLIHVHPDEEYKRSFELSHKTHLSEEEDEKLFAGVLELTTIATVAMGKQKFKAKLVLEGFFAGRKDAISLEQFEKMLNINGVTALYSIARSILISVSAQTLDNGSITLPMINAYEYSKNVSEDKNG